MRGVTDTVNPFSNRSCYWVIAGRGGGPFVVGRKLFNLRRPPVGRTKGVFRWQGEGNFPQTFVLWTTPTFSGNPVGKSMRVKFAVVEELGGGVTRLHNDTVVSSV